VIAPAGEQLLPRAERMEDEAHAIARELAGRQERLTGLVRVTTSDAFGPRVVAPILAEFHARYPEVEIELGADNRVLSLSRREADISVRFSKPVEQGLVVRKLTDFAYAPYCASSYVAARGKPVPPFEGHDFVASDESRTETAWFAQRAAKGRVALRTVSTHVNAAAAVAGFGIALLPCYVGDEEPSLVRVGPLEASVQRAVWLVVHRDLQHAARIRACADFVAERVRAQADRFSGKGAGARADARPTKFRRRRSRGDFGST
jgi:DNA-binding transcriptional LysR family regulator